MIIATPKKTSNKCKHLFMLFHPFSSAIINAGLNDARLIRYRYGSSLDNGIIKRNGFKRYFWWSLLVLQMSCEFLLYLIFENKI